MTNYPCKLIPKYSDITTQWSFNKPQIEAIEKFNTFNKDILIQDLIADKQKSDSTRQGVLTDTTLAFQEFPTPFSSKTLYCDVKLGFPRPYIPPTLRRLVFHHLLGLSHPSKPSTVKLIADRFVWPNMKSDIRDWVSKYLEC